MTPWQRALRCLKEQFLIEFNIRKTAESSHLYMCSFHRSSCLCTHIQRFGYQRSRSPRPSASIRSTAYRSHSSGVGIFPARGICCRRAWALSRCDNWARRNVRTGHIPDGRPFLPPASLWACRKAGLSGRLGCPPPFVCHTPGADLGWRSSFPLSLVLVCKLLFSVCHNLRPPMIFYFIIEDLFRILRFSFYRIFSYSRLFHSAYLKHFFISFVAPCSLMFIIPENKALLINDIYVHSFLKNIFWLFELLFYFNILFNQFYSTIKNH